MRECRLAGVEQREDVRAERALELLGGDVLEALVGHLVGGVVDEDVDPAELGDRSLDDVAAIRLVGHVARQRDAGAFRILDEPQRRVRVVLLLGEVRDRDVGALARERQRYGSADAGVAAGDQRAPARR